MMRGSRPGSGGEAAKKCFERMRTLLLLPGGGKNSCRQNPAADAGPRNTSPASAERSGQLGRTSVGPNGPSLPLPWIRSRAVPEETSACFGGRNFSLPRASAGFPNSRCLNFFTASGGRRQTESYSPSRSRPFSSLRRFSASRGVRRLGSAFLRASRMGSGGD